MILLYHRYAQLWFEHWRFALFLHVVTLVAIGLLMIDWFEVRLRLWAWRNRKR